MVSVQKGKCFECNNQWYWCKECGAAGCATTGCSQQKRVVKRGFIGHSQVCRVCGEE